MCSANDSVACLHWDEPAIVSTYATASPPTEWLSSASIATTPSANPREHLPIDMTFNDGHVVSIVTYSVLLVVSVCGNVTVLVNLLVWGRRRCNPRVSIMLIHLAIADLMVALLLMPIEIGWAATVQWRAGDSACRILAFFRTFGLFLSSFVLVCISIDRFGAILQPMKLNNWKRRGRMMLAIAWVASFICSLPQVFIFHVESHPDYPWYEQCVTFNAFPTRGHEIFYAAFGMIMMYALPLIVFAITYGSILHEISRHSTTGSHEEGVRRVTEGALGRARIKTVKMTLVIISVFILCWTPYNIMSIWFWCDRDSALQVDQRVQKGLFLFACANSCFNPIVYGIFSRRRVRRSQYDFQRKTAAVYHPSRAAMLRAMQPYHHQYPTVRETPFSQSPDLMAPAVINDTNNTESGEVLELQERATNSVASQQKSIGDGQVVGGTRAVSFCSRRHHEQRLQRLDPQNRATTYAPEVFCEEQARD